jgi:mono/diheme cytochrome c family protein
MYDFVASTGRAWLAFGVIIFAVVGVMVTILKVSEWLGRPKKPSGPRRLKVSAIAFALIALAAADASACNRCGLFGNRCRYYTAATYVAPIAAVPASQNVYVIQNSYPAPLVGQGSSAVVSNGGYQSLTIGQFDPTAFLSQSLQLVKAGQDAATLAHTQAQATATRALELQAPTVERLAAGQAASQVLKAAGLDPAHNASGSSSAVVISRNPDGQVQVMPLEGAEVAKITARLSSTTTITQSVGTTAPAIIRPSEGPSGLVAQFCAQCHGTNLAAPKGGFYIGDDRNVAKAMREKFFDITQHLTKGTMPPANSPQPTDEQKRGILDEIQALILKE